MKNLSISLWTSLLLLLSVSIPISASAQDPGVPDTVRFECSGLAIGQSLPLDVIIVNDNEVNGMFVGLLIESIDTGFARFDSAVWINRMADPSIMNIRGSMLVEGDTIAGPYDIRYGGANLGVLGKLLPVGNDAVTRLFFTGLKSGVMSISGVSLGSGGDFIFVLPGSIGFTPTTLPLEFNVNNSAPPPVLSVSSSLERLIAGSASNIIVTSNKAVTINSLTMQFSSSQVDTPTNLPTVTSINNSNTISWISTAQDIGVWAITAEFCDTAGICAQASIEVQVVSNLSSIIDFELERITDFVHAAGITHANLDSSPYPEIIAVGDGLGFSAVIQTYGVDDDKSMKLNMELLSSTGRTLVAPQVGFIDSDDFPELVTSGIVLGTYNKWGIQLWDGVGDGQLAVSQEAIRFDRPAAAALSDFNHDGKLDYLAINRLATRVSLFAGDGDGFFTLLNESSIPDVALSVGYGDFDRDGHDDIALGTRDGLGIHLNDGNGNFLQYQFYSHTFRTEDVSTTLSGTDFNSDGLLDLVVAAPSVGGASSEIFTYLGNGDGSFNQSIIRTPLGQAIATSVGDFNGDLNLDIAYINSSNRYFGILFGSGDGLFDDELRFLAPDRSPIAMDVMDLDLDGDLDIVVATAGIFRGHELMIFRNQSGNGANTVVGMDISALDNGLIKLSDPMNRSLDNIASTIPSGEYFQRNLDGNALIDDYVKVGAVESGKHQLRITPKPDVPVGHPVTLEYQAQGRNFRLAKDLPLTSEGYTFDIYPDGTAPAMPLNGAFVGSTSPGFFVGNTSGFEMELANDYEFESSIHQATIAGTVYAIPIELAVSDTTLYYWRYKADGGTQWSLPLAINVYSPSGASCGDVDESGSTNIADITYLVAYVFTGSAAPTNSHGGDVNNSGSFNIADIVYMINYLFAGGEPPVCQ